MSFFRMIRLILDVETKVVALDEILTMVWVFGRLDTGRTLRKMAFFIFDTGSSQNMSISSLKGGVDRFFLKSLKSNSLSRNESIIL